MTQEAILKKIRRKPIRVKGLRRFFARIAGWLHARKQVITVKDGSLQAPFFSAQMAHYAAFSSKDCARIEELLTNHKERYAILSQQLETLSLPVPEVTGDSPEANKYRYNQAVAARNAKIQKVQSEMNAITEMICQCERIYEDRCAHARGKVMGRISAYRSGAARALKAQGIDCNAPLTEEFPPTRTLLAVFTNEKEVESK